MVHGLPDWGLRGPKSTTYGLDDLGEAVARLGSPVVWDRRGDVIRMESFGDGAGSYVTLLSGLGAAVHRTCGGAHTGAYGLELIGGSTPNYYAYVSVNSPAPVLGPCGFEAWFGVAADTQAIDLQLVYLDGTHQLEATLRYDHVAKTLALYTDGHVWAVIDAALSLNTRLDPEHVAKVVADFSTGYYERVIIDSLSYDVHTHLIDSLGFVSAPYFWGRVRHISTAGWNAAIIVDDLILTQNEPVSL